MTERKLRLGGFFSVPGNHLAGWRHPDAVPSYDMDFQGYAHITQVAEAAKRVQDRPGGLEGGTKHEPTDRIALHRGHFCYTREVPLRLWPK